jgi:predicted nucleotidyltransferase
MIEASKEAQRVRSELAERVAAGASPLIPADTSLIVFGSLARGEWTQKSDLDWTILVDGQVDGSHTDAARKIRRVAEELKLQEPGPSGMFGRLTFSHDLVHLIGGEDDTNTNTSRRILLILESVEIGEDPDRSVRSRVLRALLDRYIGEDLFYHAPKSYVVPRFLLNDVCRYWRTMTVDSAQKRRDRADRWALRNIKLRLSRKLIFAAGFWRCLSCDHDPSEELVNARATGDRSTVAAATTKFLLEACRKTPLETLALAFLRFEAATDAARVTFGAYEDFLAILNDEADRKILSDLDAPSAEGNPTFKRAKESARAFQDGLSKFFFNTDPKLTKDAQSYGVF